MLPKSLSSIAGRRKAMTFMQTSKRANVILYRIGIACCIMYNTVYTWWKDVKTKISTNVWVLFRVYVWPSARSFANDFPSWPCRRKLYTLLCSVSLVWCSYLRSDLYIYLCIYMYVFNILIHQICIFGIDYNSQLVALIAFGKVLMDICPLYVQ